MCLIFLWKLQGGRVPSGVSRGKLSKCFIVSKFLRLYNSHSLDFSDWRLSHNLKVFQIVENLKICPKKTMMWNNSRQNFQVQSSTLLSSIWAKLNIDFSQTIMWNNSRCNSALRRALLETPGCFRCNRLPLTKRCVGYNDDNDF